MPTGITVQRDLEALPGHEGGESARPRRRRVSRQKVIADTIAKLEEFLLQIAAVVARASSCFQYQWSFRMPAASHSGVIGTVLNGGLADRPFRWHPEMGFSLDAAVRGSCPNVPSIRRRPDLHRAMRSGLYAEKDRSISSTWLSCRLRVMVGRLGICR